MPYQPLPGPWARLKFRAPVSTSKCAMHTILTVRCLGAYSRAMTRGEDNGGVTGAKVAYIGILVTINPPLYSKKLYQLFISFEISII